MAIGYPCKTEYDMGSNCAFPYGGINHVRFKGTLSILFQNTPKAEANIRFKV